MLKPLLRFDMKGSKKWLMDAELVGLSEKDKNAILQKKTNGRFAPFWILSMLVQFCLTALTEWVARSVELGCVKTCSADN